MHGTTRLGRWILACGVSLAALTGFAASAHAALDDFVKTPDPAYSWKLKQKTSAGGGTIYDIELVSQVWHGITWKHQLQVFLPNAVKPSATLFLWNQGGQADVRSMGMMMTLAKKMQAPVAFLYGIPNQPLFGGKSEDALIAETFVRY
jgi:PhoPQ-activated pathogenicity-related protein